MGGQAALIRHIGKAENESQVQPSAPIETRCCNRNRSRRLVPPAVLSARLNSTVSGAILVIDRDPVACDLQ